MSKGLVNKWTKVGTGPSNFGKVKCPKHYALIPGRNPYLIKPIKEMKNISQGNINYVNKQLGTKVKKWTYVRDKYGNKIRDFRNYYQPLISRPAAVEHIWEPDDPICMSCRRCLEGIGRPNINSINRLRNG